MLRRDARRRLANETCDVDPRRCIDQRDLPHGLRVASDHEGERGQIPHVPTLPITYGLGSVYRLAMRNVLLAATLSLASIAGCAKSDKAEPAKTEKAEDTLPSMTVDEVDSALAAKQATAVDCNGDKTRKKLGVVPGAILVSDEETFAAGELPADKSAKLVFYCANPG